MSTLDHELALRNPIKPDTSERRIGRRMATFAVATLAVLAGGAALFGVIGKVQEASDRAH